MYAQETIEEIKAKSKLIEVVEAFTIMKPNGSSLIGKCPLHEEKTPSFHIKGDRYRCFGCGKGGDIFQFLADKENLSYPDSLRYLANKYNITLVEEGSQNYTLPKWKNKTDLSPSIVKWFENRRISQKTLIKMKISEGLEYMPQREKEVNVMHFNYFRDDILVNIKYRDSKKSLKLHKGSELILYNLDSLKGKTEAILVEGEPDCLAVIECGLDSKYAILSVPNGASEHRNNLQYLNNCIKYCEHIEKWHLGFDNDSNGRKLREDIAERFGKDKCDYIEWKDKKDANEVLMWYGVEGVIECCSKPIKFPLEGAFTISDFSYEIEDMRLHGLNRGMSIGLADFNLRFVKGYINVITGLPGSGKSELVDDIGLRLTIKHNENGAFYSPENKPTQLHYSKLARRLTGKSWDGIDKITKEEELQVRSFLEKKIWFIKPAKDFSLTSILDSIRELHKRHGLGYFVIDAWNKLEHKDTDTYAVGKALDELALFCEAENLICFLVAHPKMMQKDKKTGEYSAPSMYDISGSANFANKADNVIAISIDRAINIASIHLLKVKFSHWGWYSNSNYKWEPNSGRYYVEGYPDFTNWITGKVNTTPINSSELPLENGISIYNKESDPF
jgi:twinkle protein